MMILDSSRIVIFGRQRMSKRELFARCMNKIHYLQKDLKNIPWHKFKDRKKIKDKIQQVRDMTPMRFG